MARATRCSVNDISRRCPETKCVSNDSFRRKMKELRAKKRFKITELEQKLILLKPISYHLHSQMIALVNGIRLDL